MESMSIFDEISGVQGSEPVCRCAKSPIWCAGAHGSREAGVHAADRTDLGVPNSTVFLYIVLQTKSFFYDTMNYQRLCKVMTFILIYSSFQLNFPTSFILKMSAGNIARLSNKLSIAIRWLTNVLSCKS